MKRVTVVATLVITASMGAFFMSGSSATAASAIHKAKGVVNSSAAVEGKAKVSFSCNGASGQWNLQLSNVQVISSDHVSPWSSPIGAFVVTPELVSGIGSNGIAWTTTVKLVQDGTSGLFGAVASGFVQDSSACAKGETFILENSPKADLYLQGSLG